MFTKYFEYYTIILGGVFFVDTLYSDSAVSCVKTAEPIEMPSGLLWARVGSRNHVLNEGPDRPMRRGNF